jgi:hypothetical protein
MRQASWRRGAIRGPEKWRMKDQQETSHCRQKSFPRSIDDASSQRLLGRGSDGMHQKIDSTPIPCNSLEDLFQLPGNLKIQRQEDRSAGLAGQGFDIRSGLVVDVGDRELRAQRAERQRARSRSGCHESRGCVRKNIGRDRTAK